jgi:hypothetical protein
MKDIKSNIDSIKAAYPNFVEVASRAFRSELAQFGGPCPAGKLRTSATRQRSS